jgi:hypothetical protein
MFAAGLNGNYPRSLADADVRHGDSDLHFHSGPLIKGRFFAGAKREQHDQR